MQQVNAEATIREVLECGGPSSAETIFASMCAGIAATTDQSEDTSLQQLVQSGGSLVQSGGHGGSSSANAPWSDGETKLLLDYYAK
ncbi:hypothetical protein MTO96_015289 [Rhipicephalus appendiculatus]